MAARREVTAAVAERYRAAGRREKGRILDELCATTGWHRKHALRVFRAKVQPASEPRPRERRYGASVKDALVALWEASDRVCGKRLKPMIPVLLPALIRHGRLKPTQEERTELLLVSAATIDRMLVDVKIAAAGGRRRRVGFYSAIRREVPIRTFNDWGDPTPSRSQCRRSRLRACVMLSRRISPSIKADVVICINMIHIAPWSATVGLMRHAALVLPAGGLLYLYGPYRRNGEHTAPSNAAFDADLKSRNPAWGVRNLETVAALAAEQGFFAPDIETMPANNLSLVFRRR